MIDVAGGHWRKIVRTTGLGTSFMGSMFLALTTSLPKIVASVAALAFYDPVNVRGDLWQQLNPIHGFTAVAAALMTVLAIVGV